MIENPQTTRRVQEQRSQVAMEIFLILYAVVATIVLMRTVLVLLDVNDRVWIGSFVYSLTAPVTNVLERVPGFTVQLIGPFTLVDLLLLAAIVLFPLGLLATSTRTGQ